MGSCNSCCGERDDVGDSRQRHHIHRQRARREASQQLHQRGTTLREQPEPAPSPPDDGDMKRALVASAAEERIKQMENRGGGGVLAKKLAQQTKSTASADHASARSTGAEWEVN